MPEIKIYYPKNEKQIHLEFDYACRAVDIIIKSGKKPAW